MRFSFRSPFRIPTAGRLPGRPCCFELDPKVLEKYVGRYRFSPEVVLTITRAGNTLFVQENDEPKQELGAEGERQFFSKTADDEYSFELDGSGRVTTMTLHTGGKDLPMKREP